YDRVALSSYVDSWDAGSLALPGAEYTGDDRVELRLGDPVVRVDRETRTVVTASGAEQHYDALVLATGSYPFVPPVSGPDLPGCPTAPGWTSISWISPPGSGRATSCPAPWVCGWVSVAASWSTRAA